MQDKDNTQKEGAGSLSKKQLWDKAGTSQNITRDDLGIAASSSDSGMQILNEGFLGGVHRFTLDDEKKD